ASRSRCTRAASSPSAGLAAGTAPPPGSRLARSSISTATATDPGETPAERALPVRDVAGGVDAALLEVALVVVLGRPEGWRRLDESDDRPGEARLHPFLGCQRHLLLLG